MWGEKKRSSCLQSFVTYCSLQCQVKLTYQGPGIKSHQYSKAPFYMCYQMTRLDLFTLQLLKSNFRNIICKKNSAFMWGTARKD